MRKQNRIIFGMATALLSSVAISQDRNFSWAHNAWGTLGNNTQVNENFPKAYPFVILRRLAGGKEHSLAVDLAFEVWAFGNNEYGQLGNGDSGANKKSLVPIQVLKAANTKLTDCWMVAAGRRHSLALDNSGQVWAWGENEYGQIGNRDGGVGKKAVYATKVKYRKVSDNTFPDLTDVRFIAAGEYFSLALKEDGTVWAWGRNNMGQLGQGDAVNKDYAVQVKKNATTFLLASTGQLITIAAGGEHAYAIEKDFLVIRSWGNNDLSQLGRNAGASANYANGVVVKAGVQFAPAREVFAGYKFGTALTFKDKKVQDQLIAWGSNEFGQLGNSGVQTGAGKKSQDWVYVQIKKGGQYKVLTDIERVACGENHVIASVGQDLYTWGRNNVSQLGNNADLDGGPNLSKSAVRVMGPGGIGWMDTTKYFSCGWNHNLVFNFKNKVKGNIGLRNLEGDPNQLVRIELRDINTNAIMTTRSVILEDNGDYTFSTDLEGAYRVWARGENWLGQLNPMIVHMSVGGVNNVDFDLINGDVNGDNEVNLFDIAEIAYAFGSIEGDPTWNFYADLNRDEEVNLVDYSIASSNFGQAGDE